MIQIRKNTFETNSSSAHTLVIDDDIDTSITDKMFIESIKKSGNLIIEISEYHDTGLYIKGLYDKICYFGAHFADYYSWNEDEKILNKYKSMLITGFKNIYNVNLKIDDIKFTNINIDNELTYIPNQSHITFNGIFYNDDKLYRPKLDEYYLIALIFSPNTFIITAWEWDTKILEEIEEKYKYFRDTSSIGYPPNSALFSEVYGMDFYEIMVEFAKGNIKLDEFKKIIKLNIIFDEV